jgi:hypothetical protein
MTILPSSPEGPRRSSRAPRDHDRDHRRKRGERGGLRRGPQFHGRRSADRPFSQDRRIIDPRGLSLDPSGELVYLNSGDDPVLTLDRLGRVALDSGQIDGLDPGGGNVVGQETSIVPGCGLFVFIGAAPCTGWIGSQLAQDDNGFLLTGADLVNSAQRLGEPSLVLETSPPGVFCVVSDRRLRVQGNRRIRRVAVSTPAAVTCVSARLSRTYFKARLDT